MPAQKSSPLKITSDLFSSKSTLRYGPELLDTEVWIYKNLFCSILHGVKEPTVVMMMILENKMKQV